MTSRFEPAASERHLYLSPACNVFNRHADCDGTSAIMGQSGWTSNRSACHCPCHVERCPGCGGSGEHVDPSCPHACLTCPAFACEVHCVTCGEADCDCGGCECVVCVRRDAKEVS